MKSTAELAMRLRMPAWLLTNNRAEGSAPHTIIALARMIADAMGK